MIYRNENNTGIDNSISFMQDVLFKTFSDKWGKIDLFGRVHRNYRDSEYYPEVHTGNGEYKDVYLDDSVNACIFFIDSDSHLTDDSFTYKTDLDIVVMMDLGKIYKSRKDSLVHSDFTNSIKRFFYSEFSISELCKGVDNCLTGFNTNKIKHLDVQPYHTFSIKGNLTYYINNCCNGRN